MEKRAIPMGYEAVPPATEAFELIRLFSQEKEAARQAAEAERNAMDKRLAQLSLDVHRLTKAAGTDTQQGVRICADRLQEDLRSLGIEVVDYTGKHMAGLLGDVIVSGWVPGDTEEDMVLETFEPEIRRDGRLIHTAKVFGCSAQANTDEPSAPADEPVSDEPEKEQNSCGNGGEVQPAKEPGQGPAIQDDDKPAESSVLEASGERPAAEEGAGSAQPYALEATKEKVPFWKRLLFSKR